MKTKKRFFTLMLALALAVCMAVPAFASNEDSNFMIPIASNYTWGANEVSVRKKDNIAKLRKKLDLGPDDLKTVMGRGCALSG